MKITKKLGKWQQKGLITAYQSEQILEFELKNNKKYIFYGLMTLAVFCIGLGIIALVAANWAFIAPSAKLGGALSLLLASALATFETYRRQKNVLFDIFLIFFELLLLASIGLIGQIYQLSPDSLSALFLWSVLSLPLCFFAKGYILPLVSLPVFGFSLLDLIFGHEYLFALWQKASWAWSASMPVLLIFGAIILQRVLVRYAPSGGLRKALDFWLAIALGALIYALDQDYIIETKINIFELEFSYTATFVLLFGIATGLTFLSAFLSKFWKESYLLPSLMVIVLIGSVIHLPLVLSLAALVVLGIESGLKGQIVWFNTALGLAALRLFIFYVEIFNGLEKTGISLLVAGLSVLICLMLSRLVLNKLGRKKNEK